METKIMSGQDAIELAAKLIKSGELVAFPTETVYGLGGNALDPFCVEKIYKAKGRPADNPLIVHLADVESIPQYVEEFSERNKLVAQTFMPGALTLLFPKKEIIPNAVTAGLTKVGIRVPSNAIAREFIRECGVPIAAPSANRSTRISPTKAEHVYEDMQGLIPLIIDGGGCDIGIESTVLDLCGEVPIILRPGAITADMLLDVIGKVQTHTGEVKVAAAPGMKYKHYAPTVDMALSDSVEKLIAEYDRSKSMGGNPLMLMPNKYLSMLGGRRVMDLGSNDEEVTKNIYCAMREGEKLCDYLLCIDLGDSQLARAVMNRVNKAASRRL